MGALVDSGGGAETSERRNEFGERIHTDGPCGSQNRIYRCKVCKGAKTIVLTKMRRYLGTYAERFNGIKTPHYKRWVEFMGAQHFASPTCCGREMGYVDVQGHKNETPCGAKCLSSKGPVCECSCGGANHGHGWVRV